MPNSMANAKAFNNNNKMAIPFRGIKLPFSKSPRCKISFKLLSYDPYLKFFFIEYQIKVI